MITGGLWEVNLSTLIYIAYSILATNIFYLAKKGINKQVLLLSPMYAATNWFILSISHISLLEIEMVLKFLNPEKYIGDKTYWLVGINIGINLLSNILAHKFLPRATKDDDGKTYLRLRSQGMMIYAIVTFCTASIALILFSVYPYMVYQ